MDSGYKENRFSARGKKNAAPLPPLVFEIGKRRAAYYTALVGQ